MKGRRSRPAGTRRHCRNREWPRRYAGQNVDREQWVAFVEESSGVEVSALVDEWLTSPVTPQ